MSSDSRRITWELELPRTRFHDLRHAHATQLLAAGVHPKAVSERLGHCTVAFTMDVYTTVIPSLGRGRRCRRRPVRQVVRSRLRLVADEPMPTEQEASGGIQVLFHGTPYPVEDIAAELPDGTRVPAIAIEYGIGFDRSLARGTWILRRGLRKWPVGQES